MYIIIGVLSLLVILCFILVIILTRKLDKVTKRQEFIGEQIRGEQVDVLLEKCLIEQEKINFAVNENQEKIENLSKSITKDFDKLEIVRYSSYPDDENDTSFSIGITNMEKNGIIITGLQTPIGTKLLVKKLRNGKSEDELTPEELIVINREN